ncbi:MAG: PAS domain S-box protein [Desulfosudaceae bacterium]
MARKSVDEGWADKIRQLTKDENEFQHIRKVLNRRLDTLPKANALLETMISFSGCLIACLDTEFNYVFVNQAYARACGGKVENFQGENYFKLYPDDDCRVCFEKVLKTGLPVFLEARPVVTVDRPTGRNGFWNQGLLPVKNSNGEIEHLLLSCEDVTRHLLSEETARRFQAVADHSAYGLAIMDMSGRLTYVNDSFARFHGYRQPEELIRHQLSSCVDETECPLLEQQLEQLRHNDQPCLREWRHRRLDGSLFPAYMNLAPVNQGSDQPEFVVVTVIDISDTKQFQKQLIEAEKMAVFGRLATNVVHEASSPLQTAMITLSNLETFASENQRLSEDLNMLKEAFDAIHRTITGLLDLYRPSLVKRRSTSINNLVKKTLEQLGVLFKRNNIEVILQLDQGIPRLETSPHQLNHCLLNICTNAVEAITGEAINSPKKHDQKNNGARITIQTRQVDQHVLIDIADTGPGIAEERVDAIFEPFFSQKQSGLGIGLTRCREVVENEGGQISARNLEDGGALISLKLPVREDLAETE